jgi:hypothetical protein
MFPIGFIFFRFCMCCFLRYCEEKGGIGLLCIKPEVVLVIC